jgi:alpha-L-fucosidase 2
MPASGSAGDATMELQYDKPAKDWNEALPVGNGFSGAMIFGGIEKERIQINEDTLWSGGPRNYNKPKAYKQLERARRLIFAGKAGEARALMMDHFRAEPEFCMAYQPMTDLYIETDIPKDTVSQYTRQLDLNTAIHTVSIEYNGITYTRQTFASHPGKAIFVHMTADKPGMVSCTLSWGTVLPEGIDVSASGDTLSFNGQLGPRKAGNLAAEWTKPGLRFAGMAHVDAQAGTIAAKGDKLVMKNSDSVTVIIGAATSFVNPDDIDGDEKKLLASRMAAAQRKKYQKVKDDHIADHQSLMSRAKLELPAGTGSDKPTNVRLQKFSQDNDPALAALLFNYGRYLLIASSRPGTQPANLQGIWNDNVSPSWGCKYTININAEMNYWPAVRTNLDELQLPLFKMMEEMVPKGRVTAKRYYDAPGWVAHHNTDLWRNCAPVDWDAAWFPASAAWLCTHIWSHYEYTGDKAFLERMYPVMRQACKFYLYFLVEHPDNPDWLVTCPTHSPEHGGLSAGTTMDNQILREFFDCAYAAGEVVGEDKAFLEKVKATQKRLPPNQVGKHGQLQEWLDDIDDPNNKHRHVSHMWGVFPGSQISKDTPKLLEAAKKSLDFRGDAATGWSVAWKTALWARLGDGDRAYKLLSMLLSGGCYPNLFDVGPPFQIDGNFGIVAGISEMLLQTHRVKDGIRQIDILPSLPAAWPTGKVSGLRVQDGFEVDIVWKSGRLDSVTVKSIFGRKCDLNYDGKTVAVSLKPGGIEKIEMGK